jgi:AcrR family transcriptional regulator
MNVVYHERSMNATVRREQHRQELRRVVLDAAREIFAHEGYESFSMRKLAKNIEYSPGSIYLHFKNKEELFETLVEESFERLQEALNRIKNGDAEEDPTEALKKGMRAYVEFGLRNPNDYRFAFLLRPPVLKRPYRVHPAFGAMRYMVGRCVNERRFRPVDIETASQALWAAIHGITSLLIQRPTFPWAGKKQVIEQVINNAVDSLTAAPGEMTEAGAHYADSNRT